MLQEVHLLQLRRAGPGAPPSLLPLEIFIYLGEGRGGEGKGRGDEPDTRRKPDPGWVGTSRAPPRSRARSGPAAPLGRGAS